MRDRGTDASQEKAFVTGLEAANRVVELFREGTLARIVPVEEDEPHVTALRQVNQAAKGVISRLPFANYFL